MNKLLVICGPTATGKTDLGIFLAKKFNGEIISADSRQVYRGMDIGTGKDLPVNSQLTTYNSQLGISNKRLIVGFREKEEIPIWLVDIVEPDYAFNVGEYRQLASKVLKNIRQRGKLPIIVGGTGLYIRAILEPLDLINVPPNIELRKKLDVFKVEELQLELKRINSARFLAMNESDRQNPRRLIRAIEVEEWNKQQNKVMLNSFQHPNMIDKKILNRAMKQVQAKVQDDVLKIGLTASKNILFNRIRQRVQDRVKQGLLDEIKLLLKKGYSWNLHSFSATGYKEWQRYFELRIMNYESWEKSHNELLKQAIQQWQLHEEQYVKRQFAWFNKDKRIKWFDITPSDFRQRIEQTVRAWYTE